MEPKLFLEQVVLWVHIMAMIGAMGGLCFARTFWKEGNEDSIRAGTKMFNIFIGIGFLVGLILYYIKVSNAMADGVNMGGRFHAVIGLKLILLLVSGALVGVGAKKARSGQPEALQSLSLVAVLCLAAAALMGVFLQFV